MSNRGGFGNGFWLGTLVGGVVGGVIGATIDNQRANRFEDEDGSLLSGDLGEKRPLKSGSAVRVDRTERTRRNLDDKISDLNSAIDAVRSSIGHTPEDTVDMNLSDGEISAEA